MAVPYINAGMAAKNVPVRKPLPVPAAPGPYKGYVNAPGASAPAAARYIGAVQAAVTRPAPSTQAPTPPATQTQAGGASDTPPGDNGAATAPQGSSLPYAGIYLEKQNAAETAYEKAQQQLLANRNTLYHRYGLTPDAKVDPYNSYGQYQQLLASEGGQLDDAYNNAVGRGIGTSGLAHQAESRLRFAQAGQNLDFQSQVDQAGADYAAGLGTAQSNRDDSMYQAEKDSLAAAIAEMQKNGSWTPVGPTDSKPPVNKKAPINKNLPIPGRKAGGRMVMQ